MKSDIRAPLPVLLHVNKILHGRRKDAEAEDDEIESAGLWTQQLNELKRVNELTRFISEVSYTCNLCQTPIEDDNDPLIVSLRAERQSHLDAAESYACEIAMVERLADPSHMSEAFELLADDFDDDHSWPAFIDAAQSARKDFAEYRRLGKEAVRLSREVSAVADQLAILVRDLRETGVRLPSILMPRWGKDGDAWGSLSGSRELRELKIRRMVESLFDQWNTENNEIQPDVRKMLRQMSEACSSYSPDFMDLTIESAIATRQNSKISAFLRAFAASLHAKKINLTPTVKRAMAIAANALMNDPELNITEDHVRKALANVRLPPKPAGRRGRGGSRKTRMEKTS